MFLWQTSVLLWTLVVMASAEPVCDPETQYLLKGACCQKCKPGTSMVSPESPECRSPVCKDCGENEYMDTYNNEGKCKSQPYCDPNSNFKWPESSRTTERHQCLCEEGFHCSSTSCLTCVPHSECEPGSGASTAGDQTHDTVCEKCPDGTFSDEKSWNGTCKKKTMCLYGVVAKDGSRDSDDECAPTHLHIGLIVFFVLLVLVAAIVAGVLYKIKCKGKTGHEPLKMPIGTDPHDYFDKVAVEDEENRFPFIANPTEDRVELRVPAQESHHSGPPEETEDVVLTANGDVLSQDGKEHVLSQPETQAITIN